MAGRFDGGDELEELHEINMTPFIDVMLVLLIIFMVAAPLATVDIPVDLPAAAARPQPRPDRPLFLTLRADLSLHLGDGEIAPGALAAALDAASAGDREARIFLRADRSVSYGDVVAVMNGMRAAGYLKVVLVGLESVPAPPASP
jgi:biopolymer transport protein ExbD